jgi:hypothetical protein
VLQEPSEVALEYGSNWQQCRSRPVVAMRIASGTRTPDIERSFMRGLGVI